MSKTNYAFSVGCVRALEARLLSNEHFLRFKGSLNFEQFKSTLKSFSYDFVDFFNFDEFDLILKARFLKIVNYFIDICPSKEPFEVLFFHNDCHNLKAILFSKFFNFDFENLVLRPNMLSINLIEKCAVTNDFDDMPLNFKMLAVNLNEMLERNLEKFEIVNEFNKLVFEVNLKLCLNLKDEFFVNRVKLKIDLFNLKLILKILDLKLDENILKVCLVDGGNLNIYFLLEAFNGGLDDLVKFFKLNFEADFLQMVKNPGYVDLFAFEKLRQHDLNYCNSPFSFAAIAAYLTQLKREHEILKKILIEVSNRE